MVSAVKETVTKKGCVGEGSFNRGVSEYLLRVGQDGIDKEPAVEE